MSKQNAEERRACLFDCMMSVVKDAPCRKRGKCIYPDQCKEVEKEIRSLIENMDKKVSKEVWNKWTARIKDDYNLGPMHVIYLVKEMLAELGLEVEEEK